MKRNVKKDLIADAALRCFLASGYNGTSVNEIADAAGFSKGGIYWHFKSKEDIFIYIVEKWIRELDSGFMARLGDKDSATDKLYKFMQHQVDNADNNMPGLIMEFFMHTRNEQVINRIKDCLHNSSIDKIIREIMQEAVHKGEFKPVDPVTAADIFISIFHGIRYRCHTRHRDKEILEQAGITALDIFLNGVLLKK